MADALESWSEFNVAMAGATAALVGLLIVAMSVNMAEILKAPTLPPRAAASIATLVLAIVVSAIGLVPGQSALAYGIELIVLTAVGLVFQLHASRVILRLDEGPRWARRPKAIMGLVPLLSYLVAGVLLIAGSTAGLAAAAVGSILAVIFAVLFAWIALVEILR